MPPRNGFPVAHGNAARLGRLTSSQCPPADELRAATPGDPARRERDEFGRFLPGNTWARMARMRAGPRGALDALDAKADPAWLAARRWAKRGCAHRIAELAKLHGGELSAGVCALVADEWEMRGDARYLAAKARASGDVDAARASATLLAGARQSARDAWQMAALEAQARPRTPQNSALARLRAASPAPEPKRGDE